MNPRALRDFIAATHRHPDWPRIYCLGDSWFQLPLRAIDLHKQLQRLFRRECLFASNAVPGRTTADIKRRLPELARHLGALEIDLLLVSMGGNDVAGQELAEYLKSADEPQQRGPYAAPQPPVVERHVRLAGFARSMALLADDMQRIIDLRDAHRPACPVVLHSYAYPIPNGRRAVRLGGIFKAGPWLKPHLVAAGVRTQAAKNALMRWLIDEFHARLVDLAARNPGVHLVDSRASLTPRQWEDEIHPTAEGFQRIATGDWQPVIRRVLGLPPA